MTRQRPPWDPPAGDGWSFPLDALQDFGVILLGAVLVIVAIVAFGILFDLRGWKGRLVCLAIGLGACGALVELISCRLNG